MAAYLYLLTLQSKRDMLKAHCGSAGSDGYVGQNAPGSPCLKVPDDVLREDALAWAGLGYEGGTHAKATSIAGAWSQVLGHDGVTPKAADRPLVRQATMSRMEASKQVIKHALKPARAFKTLPRPGAAPQLLLAPMKRVRGKRRFSSRCATPYDRCLRFPGNGLTLAGAASSNWWGT